MINKIKISEADLYNCEGFMHEIELCDKLNSELAYLLRGKDKDFITLKDLTEVEPSELTCGLHPERVPHPEERFTKSEVNKIIKYLKWYDLSLKNMVSPRDVNKFGDTISESNLDYEDGHIASPEIEAQAEKVLEDLQGFDPKH